MHSNPSFLNDLNTVQREAVQYCDGPSLVIASAGSGKTRVLTYKIAYLINNGYKPWEIMALTFTNKAANVMKMRIDQLIGEGSSSSIWMGTFHSVFLKILRIECESIGFHSNFTIYDQGSSESMIKSIIKELNLDEKKYNYKSILSKISDVKSKLIIPQQYSKGEKMIKHDVDMQIPEFQHIYNIYTSRCKLSNALDFDDILLYTYILFDTRPELLKKYASKFKYILVDEYQDTNYAQHKIVNQLSQIHNRICAVGDDSQSIYSFRGANVKNILSFNSVYPNYKLFKLEQNYRSTQIIVNAANDVISNNKNKIDKVSFSNNEIGERLRVYKAASDIEESYYVANRILSLVEKENLNYSSFAILYRTNSQSRNFEESLRKKSIPYIVYGGLSFYQRREIKDIIAYFRLIVNNNDEDAFKRIINYPKRGIGLTTVNKIIDCSRHTNNNVWNILSNLNLIEQKIPNSTIIKLTDFKRMIERFSLLAQTTNAFELTKVILQESDIIRDLYSDMTIDGKSRQENVEELVGAINSFVESRQQEGNDNFYIQDYLSEVSLLTDLDETPDVENCVKLMTIHTAKGLEFNTIFLVGVEENLFPLLKSSMNQELEEERRLFYVAITRAEKRCFLSYATTRYRYGNMEFATKSRFIDEIRPEYLNNINQKEPSNHFQNKTKTELSWIARLNAKQDLLRRANKKSNNNSNATLTSTSNVRTTTANHTESVESNLIYNVSVGDLILHDRFGKGKITAIYGDDAQCKAEVDFDELGKKQLLLKFAKFKKI